MLPPPLKIYQSLTSSSEREANRNYTSMYSQE